MPASKRAVSGWAGQAATAVSGGNAAGDIDMTVSFVEHLAQALRDTPQPKGDRNPDLSRFGEQCDGMCCQTKDDFRGGKASVERCTDGERSIEASGGLVVMMPPVSVLMIVPCPCS
jgi:hypothetical protein